MLRKYVKKPIEVVAVEVEFTTQGLEDLLAFVIPSGVLHVNGSARYVQIETLEGNMRAEAGDYIIQGVEGEFYPCKRDIFLKTYEATGETMHIAPRPVWNKVPASWVDRFTDEELQELQVVGDGK
jgi:hypothetical protein